MRMRYKSLFWDQTHFLRNKGLLHELDALFCIGSRFPCQVMTVVDRSTLSYHMSAMRTQLYAVTV